MRIKFYSNHDLSCGVCLSASESILDHFDPTVQYEDINDILELFNIEKFFSNNIHLLNWDETQLEHYRSITKKFPKSIAVYLQQFSVFDLNTLYPTIDRNYCEDLWELLERFNCYQKIDKDSLITLLAQSPYITHDILKNQKLVKYFDLELCNIFHKASTCAEILLDIYLAKSSPNRPKTFFPPSLTATIKEQLVCVYIQSEEANPNYLQLISNAQSSKELPLSPKTILSAQRKYDAFVEDHFSKNTGFATDISVCFSASQVESYIENWAIKNFSASYPATWVAENLDYPTLLNNLIHLLHFVDEQYRSLFVHKVSHRSTLEAHIGISGKKDYYTSYLFERLLKLDRLKILAYEKELDRHDISLLQVFKWFFESYLADEFSLHDFEFHIPSENTTYLEKCKLLATEIDNVLKQFRLFVEDGIIDHDLLEVSSEHLLFDSIPSLIPQKYLYPLGKEFDTASFLFFSDQSMLNITERIPNERKNVVEYLYTENLKPEDYTYQHDEIDWLLEKKYLRINSDGYLKLASNEILLLSDLYLNDVSCRIYLGKLQLFAEEMVVKGTAEWKSSLFSKPEQDYLNYILNRAWFSNGLDLRNRYVHGTQARATNEAVHQQNYTEFLKIFALIILKINEEMCVKYPCPQENS